MSDNIIKEQFRELVAEKPAKRKTGPYTSKKALKAIEEGKPAEEVAQTLSELQWNFVREYIKDRNATQAVNRAGYNTKYPDKMGSNLLRNKAVNMAIEALMAERNLSPGVTTDYVLNKLVRTLEKAEREGNHNIVLRATELIAKHLGMFIERKEISGPDGDAIEFRKTQEAAEQFTNNILSLVKKEA